MPAETLAQGPTPEARIGHTAVYDPDSNRIFVFGGSKNKKWFNDVHILDTQTWKWTMVEVRINLGGRAGWILTVIALLVCFRLCSNMRRLIKCDTTWMFVMLAQKWHLAL